MRLLFELPIIILLIGALLGRARIGNALWFLFAVVATAQVLILVSFLKQDPSYFFAALFISMFGMIMSVAFSFATSARVSPAPIDCVAADVKRGYDAYKALPPRQKARLHRGLQKLVTFALAAAKAAGPNVAKHLRKKENHMLADIVEDCSKVL